MPSPRFNQMRQNLAALRRELLPRKFDPLGNYSDRVRTRAAGYRLLAHADIEAFLEDRCQEIALNAVRQWNASKKVSRVLVGLLAFAERSVESAPPSLLPSSPSQHDAWQKKVHLDQRLGQALGVYRHTLRNNHGVKEANVLALLLPLGIDLARIDPTWLADMDSFGAKRGVTAHTSVIRTAIDPASEYQAVKRLIAPLSAIDADLSVL